MKIYKSRNDLLQDIPKNIIIAELGVFKGEFSQQLIDTINPSKIFLVDIFDGLMGSGDKDGKNFSFIDLNESYNILLNKYQNNENIIIKKSRTEVFLNSIENNYLDMIYIDADHSYESVKQDLKLSKNKVKKNGFIYGHDYSEKLFPGVFRAVNEFCLENNLQIFCLTLDGCPTYGIINE